MTTKPPIYSSLIEKLVEIQKYEMSPKSNAALWFEACQRCIDAAIAAMSTEHVQSDTKLNVSSEISLLSVDENAFKAAWVMWLHNTDDEKVDRDSALHNAILAYECNRASKPVMSAPVSLEKCAIAADELYRRIYDENFESPIRWRLITSQATKAVLDAAGVKYVD